MADRAKPERENLERMRDLLARAFPVPDFSPAFDEAFKRLRKEAGL